MNRRIDHDPYFPWSHLGLRANPFQSLNRADWLEIAWLPAQLAAWLEQPTAVLQILGEKGSGKTSALLAISRTLRQQHYQTSYVYLPADEPHPELEPLKDGVLIVDEAQRLSRQARKRLFTSAQMKTQQRVTAPRLIYSSHEDFLTSSVQDSNDFVTYTLHGLNVHDLVGLLDRRVQFFASGEDCKVHFEPEAIDFLISTFLSDLRAMEAYLYDFFQAIPAEPQIKADTLQEFNGR